MKKLTSVFLLLMLGGALALASAIDGKWKAEMTRPCRDGNEMKITMIFDLKSSGDKVTGTITMTTPRGDRSMEISDGKLDGDKFSFTTTFEGPMGTMTTRYEGTVEGDTLKGSSTREGGQRSFPFEAKKQ